MAVDPTDSSAVAAVVQRRAATRFGSDVAVAGAPHAIGAGFDSYIHQLALTGAGLPGEWRVPLVLRILPTAERLPQAIAETAAQEWARSLGYEAPLVLDVLGPDDGLGLPAQLMQLAPGTTLLDALGSRPWRMFSLVDRLAVLQRRLHDLPTADWPGPREPDGLALRRLAVATRTAVDGRADDLLAAIERARTIVPLGIGGTPVVCHGDFHPLNVLIDGDHASVIDWTDAGLGPREADVARSLLLYRIARIAASNRAEAAVLGAVGPRLSARHLRAYEREHPLDPTRLAAWEVIHALHGWSLVVGAHLPSNVVSRPSEGTGSVPLDLIPVLQARIATAYGVLGV